MTVVCREREREREIGPIALVRGDDEMMHLDNDSLGWRLTRMSKKSKELFDSI